YITILQRKKYMSYLSLARKYRPQNFDEVVGQDHVATTLKNAITMNRAAHAYLFTGPRGVGKTSMARILAKSLNCENGQTIKPCNKCASCIEITESRGMDVIEIDGASNRGIDEIRNLKENIKFASIHGKFRIYIIDEVHMLTPEAFNALLKTLEEPPPHAKFIFATTMPHKVLATILSRCQRFDFRKISSREIIKKLEDLKIREKINIDTDAVLTIARAASGSMRDAEVILDQLISFANGKITKDDVTKVLGLLEEEILSNITDSIINGDKKLIMEALSALINAGKDPVFIAGSLIGYMRDILAVKIGKTDEANPKLSEQGEKFSIDELLYITYTLTSAIEYIKKTSLGRIPLEIALIKLTHRDRLVSLGEILSKLDSLEKIPASENSRTPSFENFTGKNEEQPVNTVNEIEPGPNVPKKEISAEKDILLLQKMKSSWSNVLNFVRNKKISIGTFLSEGRLIKAKDGIVTIGFDKTNSLHKETVEENSNKKFIEEAIRNVLGEDIFLNIESVEGLIADNPEEYEKESDEGQEANAVPMGSKKIDPMVESAIDIFDGRILDIRKAPEKGKA
ncbi:MAG: DNA polymerase III subunit gamma/tau, partial [Candidatus Omnitrophota bacterium]